MLLGMTTRRIPSSPDGVKVLAPPEARPVPTAASSVLALQSAIGNRAVSSLLARQPTRPGPSSTTKAPSTTTNAPPSAQNAPPATGPVKFPWGEAKTLGELALSLRHAAEQMDAEIDDLANTDEFKDLELWGQGDAWSHDAKGWSYWLERSGGDRLIQEPVLTPANLSVGTYAKILGEVWEHKADVLRQAHRDAEFAAEEAAKQAESLADQYDDAWRLAFRSGSTSNIRKVFDNIKMTLSLARNLHTISSGFAKEVMALADLPVPRDVSVLHVPWDPRRPIRLEVVNVNKYVNVARSLGRGLAAINIGLTLYGRGEKKPTEAEQGVKDIQDTLSLVSDIGSFLALPPQVSLITTAYIKPALKVIAKELAVLINDLHGQNQVAVEVTGDLMYPNAEPGGEEMWEFMKKVMRASSKSDIPALEGSVETFFYKHKDKIEAGTDWALPVSGWWLWEDLDLDYMDSYLYNHRKRIWALLYGSMKVPRK